ncbi:MAG: BatA and WFA domain-containing protein, partial [Candidatus Altiarchaeota archaeon]
MPAYPPLNSFLGYPNALWAFTLFIPLILLYLLKPKPRRIIFSSIMFIQHIEKSKRFRSALKKFVSDPLLLVQIMILAFLILSVADPYYKTMDVVTEREAVIIVLDASASMKATDVSPNRFSAAIESAKKVVGSLTQDDTVAIVLAEKIPILALKKATPDKALEILDKLAASGSPASLGDAMYFAKDLLGGENTTKRMYVFSDFSYQDGMDVEAAENIALREGTSVDFIRVCESHRNYAINSILAQRMPADKTRAYL